MRSRSSFDFSPRYLVGIDLGTTHTAVAYADLSQGAQPAVQLFPIEQLVGPGATAQRPLLPSVRYHPAADELSAHDCALPWSGSPHPNPLPEGEGEQGRCAFFNDPVPNAVLGE
ncbi:hypothetical protein, partial [Methylogaea oryzae]